MEAALPRDSSLHQLYPVSISWTPPYTMMVDLVGHGDPQVSLGPLLQADSGLREIDG